MKEYRVIIPEENYKVIEFIQEDLFGIAFVNLNLRKFKPKEVFPWHCSIMIDIQEEVKNESPSVLKREILDDFGRSLDSEIKGRNKEKPNALFLASIKWNKTNELIWRVYNPELTNQFIQRMIAHKVYNNTFDYRIDHDKEWKLTEWHLKHC